MTEEEIANVLQEPYNEDHYRLYKDLHYELFRCNVCSKQTVYDKVKPHALHNNFILKKEDVNSKPTTDQEL